MEATFLNAVHYLKCGSTTDSNRQKYWYNTTCRSEKKNVKKGPDPTGTHLLEPNIAYPHVSHILIGQTGAGRCPRNHLHPVHLIQDPKGPGNLRQESSTEPRPGYVCAPFRNLYQKVSDLCSRGNKTDALTSMFLTSRGMAPPCGLVM